MLRIRVSTWTLKCTAILSLVPLGGVTACAAQPGTANPFQSFFRDDPVVANESGPSIGQQQRDLFEGKKPRVVVMEFKNRSGKYVFQNGKNVGEGMEEQLMGALGATNSFSLMERKALAGVQGEIELNNGPGFRSETATRYGGLEGVDFQIIGAVTELHESQAGVGGGINLRSRDPFGIAMGLLRASGGKSKDHVAIELRVIDARTGGIVKTVTVTGSASDYQAALGTDIGMLIGAFSANAQGHYSTPMQAALRSCMIKAVEAISQSIQGTDFLRSYETPEDRGLPQPAGVAGEVPEADLLIIAVVVDEAKVKFKPDSAEIVIQTLAKGDEVELLDSQGDWVEVRLFNGKTGWMKKTCFDNT